MHASDSGYAWLGRVQALDAAFIRFDTLPVASASAGYYLVIRVVWAKVGLGFRDTLCFGECRLLFNGRSNKELRFSLDGTVFVVFVWTID